MPERAIVERLSRSKIYQDYEQAFSAATHLPLTLRPVQVWDMAHHGKKTQNPFCVLMAKSSKSCAACLQMQDKLSDPIAGKTHSATCFAGLCDSTVPVQVGDRVIGFLQTGQVALEKPSQAKFQKITRQLLKWGVETDLAKLEEAYFNSQALTREQYQAMLKLLETFAKHLSVIYNQAMVENENAESPMIQKAKQMIENQSGEAISLDTMAKGLHISTYYFCKMFKKTTGLNFTDYLARVRVEKAKNLLLNPHKRISEVAFEVGFQSLNHFNRMFKKITGQSPTLFRHALHAANPC